MTSFSGYHPTNGPRDKASYRDAWTHLNKDEQKFTPVNFIFDRETIVRLKMWPGVAAF